MDPTAGAWRAFEAYAAGVRDGSPALAGIAAQDVVSTFALPEQGRGWREGQDALAESIAWRHGLGLRAELVADGLTLSAPGELSTAAFEVSLAGTLAGEDYRTHAAVSFDLSSVGEVLSVREYYGDNATPPAAFAPYGLAGVFEPAPGQRIVPGKPPTLARTAVQETDASALRVAAAAFDAFAVSVRDGDWEPYLRLMAAGVTFTLPIPGRMRGRQSGRDAVREYHRWRWQDLRMRAELTAQRVLRNGPTVAVEFDTAGVIGPALDLRVHHWAVYYFDVADDLVVGFREYNGDEIDRS